MQPVMTCAFMLVDYRLICIFMQSLVYLSDVFLSSLQIPPVKELRKLMRIQALRCHAVYCQNGSKINVIPVLASRCQALRCSSFSFITFSFIILLIILLLVCFFVLLS